MSRICFSRNLKELADLLPEGKQVVVLYDKAVSEWVKKAGLPAALSIGLEGGETLKQWDAVARVVDRFMNAAVDRSWFLVGIGGGTVCDFAGFLASIYMRGISFGFVPTTLIAQVDAALGGKNGIHFGSYKNILGCIVQPAWIFCDPDLLRSLPLREFRCGLAECVKHGAIVSETYFRFIEEEVAGYDPAELPDATLDRLVRDSQQIKMDIVEKDLYEQGERRALNFGHTFGHAMAAEEPSLSHGQVVSKGMVMASRLAVRKGLLEKAECERLEKVLARCGLETEYPYSENRLLPYILHDKKRQTNYIWLVLLRRIGQYMIVKEPVDSFGL